MYKLYDNKEIMDDMHILKVFNREMTTEVRIFEIEFISKINVYKQFGKNRAYSRIILYKWFDPIKGYETRLNYRPRLVA